MKAGEIFVAGKWQATRHNKGRAEEVVRLAWQLSTAGMFSERIKC